MKEEEEGKRKEEEKHGERAGRRKEEGKRGISVKVPEHERRGPSVGERL